MRQAGDRHQLAEKGLVGRATCRRVPAIGNEDRDPVTRVAVKGHGGGKQLSPRVDSANQPAVGHTIAWTRFRKWRRCE